MTQGAYAYLYCAASLRPEHGKGEMEGILRLPPPVSSPARGEDDRHRVPSLAVPLNLALMPIKGEGRRLYAAAGTIPPLPPARSPVAPVKADI
jgi:hypothetical protein